MCGGERKEPSVYTMEDGRRREQRTDECDELPASFEFAKEKDRRVCILVVVLLFGHIRLLEVVLELHQRARRETVATSSERTRTRARGAGQSPASI